MNMLVQGLKEKGALMLMPKQCRGIDGRAASSAPLHVTAQLTGGGGQAE